jgi:hydrogenase expression/formation protein HypC
MSGCDGDVCITCADEAVQAAVVRLLDDDLAVVRVDGREEVVSVALVDAAVGDTVVVHAKESIGVVRP